MSLDSWVVGTTTPLRRTIARGICWATGLFVAGVLLVGFYQVAGPLGLLVPTMPLVVVWAIVEATKDPPSK